MILGEWRQEWGLPRCLPSSFLMTCCFLAVGRRGSTSRLIAPHPSLKSGRNNSSRTPVGYPFYITSGARMLVPRHNSRPLTRDIRMPRPIRTNDYSGQSRRQTQLVSRDDHLPKNKRVLPKKPSPVRLTFGISVTTASLAIFGNIVTRSLWINPWSSISKKRTKV